MILPSTNVQYTVLYSTGVQGGLENSKISGVGTNFGLQVLAHVLSGPNKQREAKPSISLS